MDSKKSTDKDDGHASSPILPSSLGLNQIRMRSSASSSHRFLLPSRTEPESSYADADRENHLQSSAANIGRVFSLTHARSLKFPPSLSRGSEAKNAAIAKEIQSPRFQAILRLTSGRKKRAPDIKSFSHELNSKGVRPIPFWKSRAVGHVEEIMAVIRGKFERLKEEVNSDLGVFAGDLVSTLEKNADFHPEWNETLEDLLVVARQCAKMPPTEFWTKCENIVQNLDDRRQELPMGTLKQAHTRLLFILTRCTRLVQFEKESGYEDDHILGLHKLSDLGVYPERIAQAVTENVEKHKQSQNYWHDHSCSILKLPEFGHTKGGSQFGNISEKNAEPIINDYKMSSWKKFPSVAERGPLRDFGGVSTPSSENSDQLLVKDSPKICLDDLVQKIDASVSAVESEVETSNEVVEMPICDQQNLFCQGSGSMICRICEVEIPTMQIEDHSRFCTVADRCDLKGLSVNERLERVLKILERIHLYLISKSTHDSVTGHSFHKHTTQSDLEDLTELSLPNKYSLSRHCSIDMLDCILDNDNLFGLYDFNASSDMSSEECTINMSDLGSKGSSNESLTPRSPLIATQPSKMEFLWNGPKKIPKHENFKEMVKLMDIVQAVSNINHSDYSALECMLHHLEELKLVIQGKKMDALVVGTFGRRIENLLQEKYVHLCGKLEDGKMESPAVVDEDSSPDDHSHGMRASPVDWCSKDRTSIEDFEIIKPVSRGAFGRVFLARKRATGDLFAIKVLKKADTICKNAVESILAERNILITVRNPFVVRFFYSFTCRENLYLVMEYLNGGDLFSLLKNLGCLEEDMARTYIAEVILALEYLHSLNIIHRDLKPDNLLLGPDGHVKLTDFGLSKVGLINSTDDLSGPTVSKTSFDGAESESARKHQLPRRRQRQKHSVVGTPDYLAPEILLGMGHGATADWWSVGIILFELIVGFPPFNADHPQKIFVNIMNRDIPWPKIPEELSHDAYDLISRLLTENPGQRLGATGAKEVKRHPFLKNINWDTLARQKATFIPSPEGVEDTSYFMSRYIWNPEDGRVQRGGDFEDTDDTDSISSSSGSFSDTDEYDDECSSLAGFNIPPLDSSYSFSNFSFKNLSQLASINYDFLIKSTRDSPNAS